MNDWISVKDRLPDNDDTVMIFPTVNLGNVTYVGQYLPWSKQWIATSYEPNYGDNEEVIQPTHWQPLPEPPKE